MDMLTALAAPWLRHACAPDPARRLRRQADAVAPVLFRLAAALALFGLMLLGLGLIGGK